ncbi:hypothetical protein SNEBB_006415 [Seison nebaliae]|nr:hypothetical protein SNEBB_006415 [Seison nebaliae]
MGLFFNDPPPIADSVGSSSVPPPSSDGKDDGIPVPHLGNTESRYRFDSAALERAATAAKDLEKSKHADKAFQLMQSQEKTKQVEYEKQSKELELAQEELKLKAVAQAAEERRRTMQEETKHQQERARYQDQLERRRFEDQKLQQTKNQEENLRRQEESVMKQEAMRRKTMEQEASLKHEYDMKRLKAELKGKAEVERDNREIRMEQIRAKAEENRKTVMEGLKTAGGILGQGFSYFLNHPNQILMTAGGLSLLALGVYSSRTAVNIGGSMISNRILKPALIRETSRLNAVNAMFHPIQTIKRLKNQDVDSLSGVVLEEELEARLREIAIATRNTKRNGGQFRNILMYGPPGTGKTLFAKKLAKHSGLDYAIMTGGDVAPMKKEGVSAIHKIFDWSQTSRKGLLLFVDEADAFLRKRASEEISEDVRAALNAFLFRTGEQSSRFMLVLASNQPEQFDWAINDRVDEIVEFQLPSLSERIRLVMLYFDKYILQGTVRNRNIELEEFDLASKCREIAGLTEGFSGREISKLIIACQAAAFASEDGKLTWKMIEDKIQISRTAHERKVDWNKDLLGNIQNV